MKIRTLILLLVLAAIAAFSALNWDTFMRMETLSLGVSAIQAPLGVVMLGMMAALTAFFLVFVVYLQTSVLFDARRHARELQANRELADQAEASRFTALRAFLEAELERQAGRESESTKALIARLDKLDQDLRSAIGHSENSLGAIIGELDDRLETAARETEHLIAR